MVLSAGIDEHRRSVATLRSLNFMPLGKPHSSTAVRLTHATDRDQARNILSDRIGG
jgi:hypothetical protein